MCEVQFAVPVWSGLRPLSPNTTCQLNVFGHDRHSLRVDRAQVCVFEQTHQIGL